MPASPGHMGVLPGLLLCFLVLRPLGPVRDPDALWHVVAGDHLLQTGQFVLTDPLSAGSDKTWILNQWLPEVVMHWADAAYGLAGVAWLLCLGSLMIFTAVLSACRQWSSPLVSAVVLAVTFLALSGSLSPRPQLVTFALTAVTTSAWLRTRRDGRPRWWLVPMTWVWAMSHGMWFMGPVVGAAVVVGLVLERRLSAREGGRQLLVPMLSVAAAGLTPVGLRLFASPFQVGGVTPLIREWQPPGLLDPAVVAALTLVTIVVLAQRRRVSVEWSTIALLLLSLVLALSWSRTVGLGAVILAPLAAHALQDLLGQPVEPASRRERWTSWAAGLSALVIAALIAPTVAASPAIGPNGLDAALSRLPSGTVVCNDQIDGGWLMLRHPALRPTMDTRAELYSIERIRSYLTFVSGATGWESYPQAVKCSHVLMPSAAPVVVALENSGRWRVVSTADDYTLLAN
jgi:hypothetical protein